MLQTRAEKSPCLTQKGEDQFTRPALLYISSPEISQIFDQNYNVNKFCIAEEIAQGFILF